MIFDPQARSGQTPPDVNSRVLEKLAAVGADVGAPTEVSVYLYFPSEEAASRAAEQVRGLGFPEVRVSASLNESWACIGTRTMAPELNAVRELAARLEEVARAHGGEYDGWEAAVHY
ncbi:MAG TPA: ribonuclease E inhibitor RraB [Longimicrobium sp.]